MRQAIVLAALALSACGGPSLSDNQEAEVRDIARDVADDVSDANDADLRARIEALENERSGY